MNVLELAVSELADLRLACYFIFDLHNVHYFIIELGFVPGYTYLERLHDYSVCNWKGDGGDGYYYNMICIT